jgi:hypothetical protein
MDRLARLVGAAALFATACSSPADAQNWGADPRYGTVDLTTGFMPDPMVVEIHAGGTTDALTLALAESAGGSCGGWISPELPDFRINYTAGADFSLKLFVQAQADTTLIVSLPDTSWRCSDDVVGLNPVVELGPGDAQSGTYDIWVGTYDPGTPVAVGFFATEIASIGPLLGEEWTGIDTPFATESSARDEPTEPDPEPDPDPEPEPERASYEPTCGGDPTGHDGGGRFGKPHLGRHWLSACKDGRGRTCGRTAQRMAATRFCKLAGYARVTGYEVRAGDSSTPGVTAWGDCCRECKLLTDVVCEGEGGGAPVRRKRRLR